MSPSEFGARSSLPAIVCSLLCACWSSLRGYVCSLGELFEAPNSCTQLYNSHCSIGAGATRADAFRIRLPAWRGVHSISELLTPVESANSSSYWPKSDIRAHSWPLKSRALGAHCNPRALSGHTRSLCPSLFKAHSSAWVCREPNTLPASGPRVRWSTEKSAGRAPIDCK